jgi:hypothetical protein
MDDIRSFLIMTTFTKTFGDEDQLPLRAAVLERTNEEKIFTSASLLLLIAQTQIHCIPILRRS